MSSDTNPYQPSSTLARPSERLPAASRPQRLLWGLAYSYPLHVLGAFYGTWLIAWATLGHMPRPSLDDPASIGGLMRVLYFVSNILLTAMPILAPLGLIASFFLPAKQRHNRRVAVCAFAVIYIAVCFIVFQIFWADPYQVVEWFAD